MIDLSSERKDSKKSKDLKEWVRYSRRRRELGVNGLTQKTFLEKLLKIKENNSFTFSYLQNKEKIFVGDALLIADIRQNPNVKNHFREKDLKFLAEKNDFAYKRYHNLGNKFYKQHLKDKNPKRAKREYQAYVLTDENAWKEFKELFQEFKKRQFTVLICYCKSFYCPKCGFIGGVSYLDSSCVCKKCHHSGDYSEFNHNNECHRFWLIELFDKFKRVLLNKKLSPSILHNQIKSKMEMVYV